jgi:photosystem II stability/assembly factor-like uncharacterized protein
MGVASGGVFRTTDGGENWLPITDHQVPVASIGDIAVSLSDPNTIYIGTGSDGVRSNVSTGRGVYKSTDNGRTWSFAGLYNAGQIGAIRIHPSDPLTVWVAANGDIFKPNAERGVFKTTDGGRTWRKTLFLNDSTGAMDVEVMPGNPDVVYAWMNRNSMPASSKRSRAIWKNAMAARRFVLPGMHPGRIGWARTWPRSPRPKTRRPCRSAWRSPGTAARRS